MPDNLHPQALKYVWMILRILVVSYAGICLLMFLCQRHYIFYPVRTTRDEANLLAVLYKMKPWIAPDGSLIGWQTATASTTVVRERWLVFHGNAGQALDRMYYVNLLQTGKRGEREGVQLCILEYPGYGARTGKPGEASILEAARQAIAALPADADAPPLYLLGESLGSGVACAMAAEFPATVKGVVLTTPYSSLTNVAHRQFPWLPTGWLLRHRFPSELRLPQYPGPVAFIIAEKDEMVSAASGLRLHERYPGRKKLWIIPGAKHNTIDYDRDAPWWREVREFLSAP